MSSSSKHIKILAPHLFILLVAISCIWLFIEDKVISMVIPQVFTMYVFMWNFKRKEIVPTFLIIALFKIVELPISLYVYDIGLYEYLCALIIADTCLAIALRKYHQNPSLSRLCGATTMRSQPIKQVILLRNVLLVGVFYFILVAIEVFLFKKGVFTTTELYNNYPIARCAFKSLEIIALWSMLIDGLYWDQLVAKRAMLLSANKKTGE